MWQIAAVLQKFTQKNLVDLVQTNLTNLSVLREKYGLLLPASKTIEAGFEELLSKLVERQVYYSVIESLDSSEAQRLHTQYT